MQQQRDLAPSPSGGSALSAEPFRWFVPRDLDGFFGLFVDNLVQLILIVTLCGAMCGMSGEAAFLLYQRILPGVAVSLLVGNLFYAWQARQLARRTGRNDVTALPYGINTPSLLVYVFFVMVPAYVAATSKGASSVTAAEQAWRVGLVACLGSGLIEFCGAFVAESVRRRTPRAALLSTLAGIAIGFISMSFTLQLIQKPLIAMLPLAIVLVTYFSRVSFPWRLPGGFVSLLAGVLLAWGLTFLHQVWADGPVWIARHALNSSAVRESWQVIGFAPPQLWLGDLWQVVADPGQWLGLLSVIIPMGLFNLLGSLQNIESAEAAGDAYDTKSSLAMNGLGTLAAAAFGSCFPTTIYIGHPGWKGLGARAGYSIINGVVITILCVTGTVALIQSLVPIEAGVPIVLWIGVVITAQAFVACPPAHAPAVAIGLFPAIAAWGMTVVQGAFLVAGGVTMQSLLSKDFSQQVNGFLLHGLISMERGYIFTCVILATIAVELIERRFLRAACWSSIGAIFAGAGLTHSYQLSGNLVDFLFAGSRAPEGSMLYHATDVAIGYGLMAIVFLFFAFRKVESVPEQAPVLTESDAHRSLEFH
ncbi:conserved hypothetical protein [Planctopirus limnophila DSM 3776]|uniref:Permease n=1 Tax=Planctopirus limnophila (strain ATCC 43296 / DSM 3776 / IFAM 1008 / Mu 290) TaxID=521674 RepID=D5SNN4_PLAL2|nr:permease [Planctopirus limnophila]ADG68148.1 conserved hypothetical protein [Planctopirus limnophila DSM 3776]